MHVAMLCRHRDANVRPKRRDAAGGRWIIHDAAEISSNNFVREAGPSVRGRQMLCKLCTI
jgi:hypothetical protein